MALYQIFYRDHGITAGAEIFQSETVATAFAMSKYPDLDWWVEQIQ